MIDGWVDLEQLRADGRRVLRWIRRQGVEMRCDPAEQEQAIEFLLPVFQALENIIRVVPLCAVYLYRQSDQPPSLRTTGGTPMRDVDGIAWVDSTPDRGRLHAIGLSVEALAMGEEYFVLLFLHEVTHVFCGGEHGPEFHAHLDRLIERYNQVNGAAIANDYQGLPENVIKGR